MNRIGFNKRNLLSYEFVFILCHFLMVILAQSSIK